MKKFFTIMIVMAVVFVSAFANAEAEQAAWPTKATTVLIPANVGGDTDTTFRALSEEISKSIGQPVTLKNVSGGSGSVATSELLGAEADGYTGMWHHYDTVLLTLKGLMDQRYDEYLDISAVVPVTGGEYILLANKQCGIKSFDELIAYAKKNPGELVIATEAGGYNHLFAEYFLKQAGIDCNVVDFGSAAKRIAALIGNQAQLLFGSWDNYKGYPDDVVCLACCAEERKSYAPDVPVLKEFGVDAIQEKFYLFAYPMGTDHSIVEKMGQEIKKAVATDAGKAVFDKYNFQPVVLTGKDALDHCKAFENKYKDLIRLIQK